MQIRKKKEMQGQALVEFALILGILLLIIFVVIESAHLLQANLTVQNAARAGGRYAITGQFDETCLTESPPCEDPRVASIKAIATEKLAGLQLDPNAVFEEPGFYLVEVFGTNAKGELEEDSAGIPGRPIIVRVSYRAPIWTPLLQPIADTVMVTGQTVMNNEKVVQANTAGDTSAPNVPNPPPVAPTPQPPPDLVLTKEGTPKVTEGGTVYYTLSVVNNGQQDATNVVLTDTLPAQLSYQSMSSCPLTVTVVASNIVACDIGQVPVGSLPIVVGVQAQALTGMAPITVTNNAVVALAGNDGTPGNNSASAITEIVPYTTTTDLAISKTGPERAPVSTAGGTQHTVEYRITVTNNGPNIATGVRVEDDLLAGMTFDAGGSHVDCDDDPGDNTLVTCNFGSLNIGESKSRVISAFTPETEGSVVNVAEIIEATPGNSVGESDSHETEFAELADLYIEKTASVGTLYAGESLTYNITVQNKSDSYHTATDVNIYDALPQYVEFLSASSTKADNTSGTCTPSGNAITCRVGNLEPGQTATAEIEVRPLRAGTLINTAQATADQVDPDISDNIASALTDVDGEADLAIEKTSALEAPYAGELVSYTLTITNSGPALASGVQVEDRLPEGVVFQYVNSSYGSCEWYEDLDEVSCYLGTLELGEVVTTEIGVIPLPVGEDEAGGVITNTAYVRGTGSDPQENNDSSAATTVLPGDPFVLLDPACGVEGTPVAINGYLWGDDVDITWEADGSSIAIASYKKNELEAGGQFTVTNFTVPSGPYPATAEIFVSQKVTGNNVSPITDTVPFTIPCPRPDLETAIVGSGPVSVEAYEPLTYTVALSNTGSEDSDAFYVGLYAFDAPLSGSPSSLTETNRVAVAAVSQLAAGTSITYPIVVHGGLSVTGTHYIYAMADSELNIEEIYEVNNLSQAVTVEVVEASGSTPTEPPAGTVTLAGRTFIKSGSVYDPQTQVRVTASDITGTWSVTAYSDSFGDYVFTNLPQETILVTGVFTVDGITYFGSRTVYQPIGESKNIYLDPLLQPAEN